MHSFELMNDIIGQGMIDTDNPYLFDCKLGVKSLKADLIIRRL